CSVSIASTWPCPALRTVGCGRVSGPSRRAKACLPASSRWCWSRKKMTLRSSSVWRMHATVSGSRSPPRRTPSIRAPMFAPSLCAVIAVAAVGAAIETPPSGRHVRPTLDISPRYGSGIHIVECLASAQVSFRRVEDLVERAGEGPLGQLGHELPTGAGWQVERALPPRPRSVLRRRHRDQAAQVLHRRERTDDLIPVAVRPLALDDVLTEPRTERQDLAPRTLRS